MYKGPLVFGIGTPCNVELLFLERCRLPLGRLSLLLVFTMGEGTSGASGTSPSMEQVVDLYNILCGIFAFGESEAVETDRSTSGLGHYNFDGRDGKQTFAIPLMRLGGYPPLHLQD